jgi:class 3 adenylate cyclase/tetratricopeptide (TPR) repeat protein
LICSTCGTENEPGRKFCGECGASLALVCPNCGTPNAATVKFCGECGAPLSGGTLAPPAASSIPSTAPASERRLVSVLFADLVGFTTLSEQRDAEEVRELLTRYFASAQQTIARYGGNVEKFIGDAVMALWGAPVAKEDDAERAVRAALDLAAAVQALGQEVGAPGLRVRAGVLTGEAAVTLGAEGQGMVAGDLVNTASRVQSAAQPGSVFVGETTKRATEAAIDYEDTGAHELKGKSEPMRLWRAVRVVGLRGGALRSTGLEPPFVGRERELRLIKELFHTAAEDRKPHLVSVVGIGGIGKSRLSWEFEKYVDGLVMETWWHRGRCLAYGEGVAFWALAEMVRMRAGILEEEESRSALDKLRAALEEHVPDAEERRYIEPRLAHLLGIEDRGTGDQENLFSAWRLFFERMSDRGPTVLLFEDLHWADSSLLDFIEYMLEWSRDRPVFILTLARPEVSDRRPNWGAGKRNFTSLFLEPLPQPAMDELLTGPVPGLPDELRERILERAEGVPFYAVETVRMLLDRGLLVRQGNEYRATGPIETLEVPESLQGLIAARLDGLAPEERKVLQDASVLGKTFFKQGVAAVSGLSEEAVEPILTSLVRKEVLTLQADPRSPERGQYGFLQDLVRKVAYETLSKRIRKEKQLAAAAYLEATTTGEEEEELVEVLASHYLDAYEAMPEAADADMIKAKARGMLIRAGERASSLGATAEAQRYLERAVELTADPLLQAELHERAGTVAWAGARRSEASSHFERAMDLFAAEGASHPAARVSARLAEVMWDRGRIKEALESMDRALQALSMEEPDEALAALAAQLGRFIFFSGETDLAAQRIETALDIAEALGLPEVLSQALNTKALILNAKGRWQEGRVLLRHALDVALEHDKPSAALRAYNNLADLTATADRYHDAEAYAQDGLLLARRVGNRFWEWVFLGLIYSLFALGKWDEAMAQRREMPEDWTQARVGISQGYVAFGTAISVYRGELDEAERLVNLFAELETSDDVQEQAEYAYGRALLLLTLGKPEEALRYAEVALAQRQVLAVNHQSVKESFAVAVESALQSNDLGKAEELLGIIEGLPPARRPQFLQAHAMRFQARLADLKAQPERIEPDFKAAIGLFREMAYPFWMSVTMLELGEWLVRQGRGDAAEPLLAEARSIFEDLKARPWLERLDRIPGGRPVAARVHQDATA